MNVDDYKSPNSNKSIQSKSDPNMNSKNTLNDNNNNSLSVPWAPKIEQTDTDEVKLRSLCYKYNGGIKVSTGPKIFRLANVQAFKTDIMYDHIATHPLSWYYKNINPNDKTKFIIIIHLQIQSINTSFITYSILDNIDLENKNKPLTNDKAFNKLFNLILNCNNKQRNNRFKLIPRIVDGPCYIKTIIQNRPCLIGNYLPTKYFKGLNYFEIDCAVDQDIIARSIIKIAHKFSQKLVVDMSWTIQGETLEELPERVLCGVTVHNMDMDKLTGFDGKKYKPYVEENTYDYDYDYDSDDYF